jgi:hypothetical protein
VTVGVVVLDVTGLDDLVSPEEEPDPDELLEEAAVDVVLVEPRLWVEVTAAEEWPE